MLFQRLKIGYIFYDVGRNKGTTNTKVNRQNIFDNVLIQRNVKNPYTIFTKFVRSSARRGNFKSDSLQENGLNRLFPFSFCPTTKPLLSVLDLPTNLNTSD